MKKIAFQSHYHSVNGSSTTNEDGNDSSLYLFLKLSKINSFVCVSYISALHLVEKMTSLEHRKFVENYLYLDRLQNWNQEKLD